MMPDKISFEQDSTSDLDNLIEQCNVNDYLSTNQLYKIYILCSELCHHVTVVDEHTLRFLSSFLKHFAQETEHHTILFEDEEPNKQHRFSAKGTSLLVLVVPPHLIICVDGNLHLEQEKIILECILGAFLSNDSKQFFKSSHFNMEKVKDWINSTVKKSA